MALGACVVNDGGDVLVKGHRLCPTQLNKTGHEGRKKKNEVPHSSNVCKATVFFPELHLMTKSTPGLVLLIVFAAASGTLSAQSHDVAAADERGFVVQVGDDMPFFALTRKFICPSLKGSHSIRIRKQMQVEMYRWLWFVLECTMCLLIQVSFQSIQMVYFFCSSN